MESRVSWRPLARNTRSLAIGLASLAALALAGQAHATSYDPSDAFYWKMPSGDSATAIATSSDGNFVYVTDPGAKRIIEFDSDGALLRGWTYKKEAPGSITTDAFGDVYVLYPQTGTIVKFSGEAKKVKVLASWNVPFAGSIAATPSGNVFVLTNFLNAVGEYNTTGKSIGGFVANLPGQWFPARPSDPGFAGTNNSPQSGYDPPYKTVATRIAVDPSGDPIVVGASYQALSDPQPDCSLTEQEYNIDTRPYPDPLVSGEAVRFTPGGTPVAHGWLSESQQSCIWGFHNLGYANFAYGWQSDATDPLGVAVDPNTGDIYAVPGNWELGAIHLLAKYGLDNENVDVNAASTYGFDHNWDLIAGNPPAGVTVDCRSDLYMIAGGGAVGSLIAKFIDQDPVPSGSCVNLSRFRAPPPTLAVFKFHVGKIGKGTVWAGCSGRLCNGSLSLVSSSSLCRNCVLSRPHHFRIAPGLQRPLSLRLTGLGRHLLDIHPGLAIKIDGRLKGGRTFAVRETLRKPSTLGARCTFPGTAGGAAAVSGTLAPAHGGEWITVQYLPPYANGLLLPAVQRTVRTNRFGRFADSYSLGAAGRWIIAVSWAGDRTHEPAAPQPCLGTVQPNSTRITLTCPTGSSVGVPAPVSGGLSGAPAGAAVALDYEEPPGTDIGHQVTTGNGGDFNDSLTPMASGLWLALAHYRGDAGHAPAEAVCQFVVSPPGFTIAVTPSKGSVQQGKSVNATVSTAVTSGTAQTLTLSASGAPGAVTFSPATITAGGSSTVTFSAPANATPGTYTITLTATGPSASNSTTYRLTVLAPSALILRCTADPNRRFISCSGRLTSGAAGIGGAQIKLSYQPPGGGSATVDTTSTAAAGSYSDMLNAPAGSLLASGNWQVQARFAGDVAHAPASKSQTVTVP